jgi:hypothetical protein
MDRILIADLSACYQNTKDRCSYSEKYYKDKMELDEETPWIDGTPNGKYKYLNGDGGNTVRYLAGFISGTVTFEGNKFQDLPEKLQKRLLDTICFEVTILKNITAPEFAKLFRTRNAGPALNPHQKRSSRLTDHADSVREIATLQKDLFEKLFSKKQLDSLDADEHVATWVEIERKYQDTKTIPEIKIDEALLDEQYDEFEGLNLQDIASIIDPVTDLFKTMKKGFEENKKINKSDAWYPFQWSIYAIQKSEDFKIGDPQVFLDKILNLKDRIETDWSKLHVDEKGTDKNVITNFNPSKGMFYNLGKDSRNGKAWGEAVIANVEQDLKGANLQPEEKGEWLKEEWGLSFKRKFSDRYSFDEIIDQWRSQNGIVKTSDGDKEITYADIVLGREKVEGDHKIPFSNAGETTLDNLEVVSREYNRKKSDKVVSITSGDLNTPYDRGGDNTIDNCLDSELQSK